MNRIPVFYIFFCILAVCSVLIIVMRWKRYVKYSNGTYINAGQNLIFKTEMSQSEIIQQLKTHNANDTLEYDFFEKNKDLIFGEKSYAFWYTTKLLYYYDRQEYNNYLELYNSKLNSKINSNLSEIIYYIISEEYDQALELLKKAIKGQKGLGYIMCLYYKIICLEKLDREVELNEAVGEISKYSSEIKYVKKIKEKYLAD